MQENEFEKQVKNKMEEFQLPPLDTAWDKVSRRISEDKRKKRYFIFLLFFGLIAAGVFSYFISERNTKKLNTVTEAKRDVPHKNDNRISADSNKNFIRKNSTPLNNPTKTVETNNNLSNSNKQVKEQPATASSFNINNSKKAFKKDSKSNKNLSANTTINTSLAADKKEIALPGNKSKVLQADTQPQHFANTNIEENNSSVDKDSASSKESIALNNTAPTVVNNNNIDSSLKQHDSTVNTQTATIGTNKKTEKKSLLNNYKIPNWQWGINALYGRSNLAENIVNFNKSIPAPLTATGGLTGGGSIDSFNSNKLYSSSSAYGIGAVVQKKILKNAVIGAGINYEHFSVKSHVSSLVNSGFFLQLNNDPSAYIINNFYRPGNASVYTNTYNFIELPVYFQQDIFHVKKVSFAYNAGFSVRQLLSSKSLIYNAANGIYYFKDGLLQKTQLQLQGGFNIKFNTGKSTSIYIGPQFSYSLTNNFKNENDGTFHFINYGLQAGLLLHKK